MKARLGIILRLLTALATLGALAIGGAAGFPWR